MTPDALVSELRRIIEGAPDADMAWTLAEVRIRDEVERLTRELDLALKWKTAWQAAMDGWNADICKLETAEAERDEARRELATAVSGLEMIAGKRPCIDNLMGNVDIALATLAALKTEAGDGTGKEAGSDLGKPAVALEK